MNYTDKLLLRSAQIAYYDINKDVIDEINAWVDDVINNTGNLEFKASFTLCELFEHSNTFKDSIYSSLTESIGVEGFVVDDTTDIKDIFILEDIEDNEAKKAAISDVYQIIDEIKNGELGSWKLVSYVFNDDIGVPGVARELTSDGWVHENFSPSGDGLCAYVFETSDDSAIVAFRGSEPITSWKTLFSDDFKSDWISADGGLALNDEDTLQQQSVYQYINNYVNSLGYDNYAFAA